MVYWGEVSGEIVSKVFSTWPPMYVRTALSYLVSNPVKSLGNRIALFFLNSVVINAHRAEIISGD